MDSPHLRVRCAAVEPDSADLGVIREWGGALSLKSADQRVACKHIFKSGIKERHASDLDKTRSWSRCCHWPRPCRPQRPDQCHCYKWSSQRYIQHHLKYYNQSYYIKILLVDHQPLTNPHALVALVVLLTLLHELSWFTKSLTVPVTEGALILPGDRARSEYCQGSSFDKTENTWVFLKSPDNELISILLQPATHHL